MMKCSPILFLFIIGTCVGNLRDYDLDSFAAMVQGNINESDNYVLPKNNEKMLKVDDNTIHDYGTFDFIIVGGGSAGTLLTRRLTEIANWKILLLEAGSHETDFSDIPGMAGYLGKSDMNWGYHTVPQKTCCLGMKNQTCNAPRGKVLGGSSTINGKMYVRGSRHDYDLWAEMGNEGWSYEEVLPYFKKTENCLVADVDPGYHKAGGLLSVTQLEPTELTNVYLEGMRELGYRMLDINGEDNLGYSQTYLNINDVGISSGGRAFIDDILHQTNFNLTLKAFVTNILINSDNITEGVEFIKHGKKYRALASKEVILSAGTINSPQILMLSGIGPKTELENLGIEVIKDLPVGKYMQDHPLFTGLMIHTNYSQNTESFMDKCERYLHHQRPFTLPFGVDSLGFLEIDNTTLHPDIQFIFAISPSYGSNYGAALNLNETNTAAVLPKYDQDHDVFISVILLHGKSRGSVTLKSKNPIDFPLVDYHWFSDPLNEDIEMMYQGILKALELLDTESFKSINATLVSSFLPSCEKYTYLSRDYWYCYIRSVTASIFHPVGTTRMGISEDTSVVDPELRVHGMKNLRVVDAGIMPETISGNTNAPTHMIAEKAADIIKRYYGVL